MKTPSTPNNIPFASMVNFIRKNVAHPKKIMESVALKVAV